MAERAVRISKFLALVLRHDPARIGLALDPEGWADVAVVLVVDSAGMHAGGYEFYRSATGCGSPTTSRRRFSLTDGLEVRVYGR